MAHYNISVPLSISGAKDLLKKIKFMQTHEKQLRDTFMDLSLDFLEVRAATYLSETVGGSEWYRVTGNLLASFRKDVALGEIINEAYYSAYVEYGTGILGTSADGYVSNASGRGSEGWRFEFDGEVHFTHGQPAHRFFQRAVEDYQTEVPKIFERAFKRVYGRVLK